MNTYAKIEKTGQDLYSKITNEYQETGEKPRCNPFGQSNNFGNYFQQCSKEESSAYWGSNKPVPDNCLKPQKGTPCNSLWNNSTRRKTVVAYDR